MAKQQKGLINKRFPPGTLPPMMQGAAAGTGETIPTPENVPARKTSILNLKPNICPATGEGVQPPSSPPAPQAT